MIIVSSISAQKAVYSTKVDSATWAMVYGEFFDPRVGLLCDFLGYKDRKFMRIKTLCM